MELDFTRLNSLAFMDFTGKKKPLKSPQRRKKARGNIKPL